MLENDIISKSGIARCAWYDDHLTLYWYDQYTRTKGPENFRKYDPARITRELLGLGADIYVLYAASQMGDAYYPSRVLPQHPALKGRDYVGDLLARLKRAGKRVVLYINWGTSRRPQWREVGPDGKFNQPWGNIKYYVPCLSSPQQGVIRRVTEELAKRYACDGLSLDMYMSYVRCTCRFCQPHLKRLLGTRKQVTDDDIRRNIQAYALWRDEQTGQYLGSLNDILAAKGIGPFHNGFGGMFGDSPSVCGIKWRERLDPYVTEVYNYSVSLQVKLHQAMKRASCALITSTSAGAFAHTPIALTEFLHYAASGLGNGGRILGVCGVGAYPDTTTSRRLLENVRKTFAFYKRHAWFCKGAELAGEAAIVSSYDTRRQELGAVSNQLFELFGMSRLLHETHIPFNFLIPEIDDTLETLRRYRLVILPSVACLSDRFVENLRRYVASGGRLLATGATGFRDSTGAWRRVYPLADVLGITPAGENPSGCFYIEDEFEPVVMIGRSMKILARGHVLRRIIPPGAEHPVFVQKDIVPGDRPAGPAVVKNRYGRGTSVYAAFEPGRFYYECGQYQTRGLLESLLAEVYPERRRFIHTNLPDTVEVSVTEQPAQGRRIIHLINKTTSGHYMGRETNHAIHQVVPVSDVNLEIQDLPVGVRVSFVNMRGTARVGRMLRVNVPRLDQYGAIVINLKK